MTLFQGPCRSLLNVCSVSFQQSDKPLKAKVATLGKSLSHSAQCLALTETQKGIPWKVGLSYLISTVVGFSPSGSQLSWELIKRQWVIHHLWVPLNQREASSTVQSPSFWGYWCLQAYPMRYEEERVLHQKLFQEWCALVSWSDNSVESPSAVACAALPVPSHVSHQILPTPSFLLPCLSPISSLHLLLTPRLSWISSFRAHDSFIQSIFLYQYLLCARLCSRSWLYNTVPALIKFIFQGRRKTNKLIGFF